MPPLSRILPGLIFLMVGVAAQSAAADPHRCHIGRPMYCFKYGGARCGKINPLGAEGCAAWQQACLACHKAVPGCLGPEVVTSDATECKDCEHSWLECMHGADAKSWPNRGKQ